jgi:hypothetical protein
MKLSNEKLVIDQVIKKCSSFHEIWRSFLCLQIFTTESYPVQTLKLLFLWDPVYYYPLIYACVTQMVSSFKVFWLKCYVSHLTPYVLLHILTTLFSLI